MVEITDRTIEDVCVIELHGYFYDKEDAHALLARVREHLNRNVRMFIIAFQNVTRFSFGNYGALGGVIGSFTATRNVGGNLKLASLSPRMLDILKVIKMDTVLEIFPDVQAALSSYLPGYVHHRQQRFGIVPRSDGRLSITVLSKLATAEVSENLQTAPTLNTIWLPATSFFLEEEIAVFERLINTNPPVQEEAFQEFFESHPKWLFLLGEQYEAAKPHVKLPILDLDPTLAFSDGPGASSNLIPDFLLKRVGLDLWDVLDIKLPSAKMMTGTPTRRRLSQQVVEAVAQLREYNRRLQTPDARKRLWNEHGIKIAQPVPMILIGRDIDFKGSEFEKDYFKESEGVRVYTYDDLHRLARKRTITKRS